MNVLNLTGGFILQEKRVNVHHLLDGGFHMRRNESEPYNRVVITGSDGTGSDGTGSDDTGSDVI